MPHPITRITIRGFKSIRELEDFELKKLNVLVGANGSGKSNLLSFFKLLRELAKENLPGFVRDSGGMSDLLFNGRRVTHEILLRIHCVGLFNEILLKSGVDESNNLLTVMSMTESQWQSILQGSGDGGRIEHKKNYKVFMDFISKIQIYHFHDTSQHAGMRHAEIVEDNQFLRSHAENIAPFLLRLRETSPKTYRNILQACRLVMPFFEDFLLTPQQYGPKTKVALSWRTKGSDYPMQPYHLSDGSIRFICLATALLQPNPPSLIVIDEPELGLHPDAIGVLAELIQSCAVQTQVVVATQSPLLLDYFSVEDMIVVSRNEGASTFQRLTLADYSVWLEEFSVGQLWTKNVIPSDPSYE